MTPTQRLAVAPKRPRWPHHLLAYMLSVPERILRFLASLVGQLGLVLSRLIPRPIREGKFYRLAVERQFRMMTDELGQANLFPQAKKLDGELATRMAVGGAVDNLMMVGLHASPIWLLLAATDVSKGAAVFLEDLGRELREAGVMAEGSRVDRLPDVLNGLHRLSNRLADAVDAPPLSMDDMRATVRGVRDGLGDVSGSALEQVPDLDALADEIRSLADASNHSLLETAGALGVGTLRRAGTIVAGGLVGTRAVAKFVHKTVWDDVMGDYFRTAKRIRRRGFYGAVRQILRPQSRSARAVFHYRFVTFLERLVSFGRWSRAPWRLR